MQRQIADYQTITTLLVNGVYTKIDLIHYSYSPEEGRLSNDLAIFKLPANVVQSKYIPFAATLPERLESCQVAAYRVISPIHGQIIEASMLVTTPCEMAFEGAFRTKNKIHLPAPDSLTHAKSGMSGGPVLNTNGELIGVFYSGKKARNQSPSYSWDLYAINFKHVLDVIKSL